MRRGVKFWAVATSCGGVPDVVVTASNQKPLVLVVDDDPDTYKLLESWLSTAGFRVETFGAAEELLDALSRTLPAVICLDIGLPGMNGLQALPIVRQRHRTVPVVILTQDRSVGSVVQAMQDGAYDYIPKPPDREKLIATIRNAAEQYHLTTQIAQLERQANGRGFGAFIGQSPRIQKVFAQLERVAPSDISVVITGESGTGKELCAQAIHDHSARSDAPFIAVNCAAVPENLQDSLFFGHERGAFTGASNARAGRFEQANKGTLFLDEVGELTPPLQAKLLRVLQERQFERVGGNRAIASDFRLVAATHRNLGAMVREGAFREDLYFRLSVIEIEVPPLRERTSDIPALVTALLHRAAPDRDLGLSTRALEIMRTYHWPGNVRELYNVLQRAAVLADGDIIEWTDLPSQLLRAQPDFTQRSSGPPIPLPPRSEASNPPDPSETVMTLDELERWAIERTMVETRGNLSEVIRRLGIGRTTLYRKLKQYGMR